jgi:hypothetical protein
MLVSMREEEEERMLTWRQLIVQAKKWKAEFSYSCLRPTNI